MIQSTENDLGKTAMQVKLMNTPELYGADLAIGECYDKGCYTDLASIQKRMHNIANVYKHSSTIEFIDYIFEIEASTKVLLEMSRHRQASYACKSSRYTLNKGEIVFEPTGIPEVDKDLNEWKSVVEKHVSAGLKNDITSLLLPQAYQYRWVAKFNARSLQNFFDLRLDKHAHFQIREVAQAMYDQIPDDHKFLFNEIYERKTKTKKALNE
jgi:thymidylate synthase (FAD)